MKNRMIGKISMRPGRGRLHVRVGRGRMFEPVAVSLVIGRLYDNVQALYCAIDGIEISFSWPVRCRVLRAGPRRPEKTDTGGETRR